LIEVNSAITWPRCIVFEALRDIVSDYSTLKMICSSVSTTEDNRSIGDIFSCFQKTTFESLGPLNMRKSQELKDPNAEPFLFSFFTNAMKVPWYYYQQLCHIKFGPA